MLTKEEIEKEGWRFLDTIEGAPLIAVNNLNSINFFPKDGYTIITKYEDMQYYVCFIGNIASLEEFKTVLRQVGV